MMLLQLPVMDSVLADRLPSIGLQVPARLHQLTNPNLWLTVLASLVILSSIRAALLFFRPVPSHVARKGVSIIPGVGVVQAHQQKGALPASPNGVKGSSIPVQKEKSSMFWGLVKWDSLPALPSMSETERGRWQSQPQPQAHVQQRPMQQVRRVGPAFEQPLPTLYQSEVPASMAKMIMSRHTFRRPSSRPPPVRSTAAPQYQRKLPSMV